MTSGEANQYWTAESSTHSQQKYWRQSRAAPANPGPVAALPACDPGRSSWLRGAASPWHLHMQVGNVEGDLNPWTSFGCTKAAGSQEDAADLQLTGLFCETGLLGPLSRNNGLRLVCSITRVQGIAGWAVWLGRCVEHDARPLLTKGNCSLLL